MSDDIPADLVSVAADLGRRAARDGWQVTSAHAEAPLLISMERNDEQMVINSLERFLPAPLRPRGHVVLHDPRDFVRYARRLADVDHTTVWVNQDAGKVVAVYDDHRDGADAGWREHTATLQLQSDPDWTAWVARNNVLGGQIDFAEHLESLAHTVINPAPATMLEVAKTFDAKRTVQFRSGVRIDNGDMQLTYEETTAAKAGHRGALDVPTQVTVRVAPYLGLESVEMTARLRWRIVDGALTIGYSLLRVDRAYRDALDRLVERLGLDLDPLPVLLGVAPGKTPTV